MKQMSLVKLIPILSSIPARLWKMVFMMVIAALLPLLLVYYQTYRSGIADLENDASRTGKFFITETEKMFSDAESNLDEFLRQDNTSCIKTSLVGLQQYVTNNAHVAAAGIVAPNGAVACVIGDKDMAPKRLPQSEERAKQGVFIAALPIGQFSYPLIVKQHLTKIRAFTVLKPTRFDDFLLPSAISLRGQIDILLPGDALWYSKTGVDYVRRLGEPALYRSQTGERYPVTATIVVDSYAARDWGEGFRDFILFVALSLVALIFILILIATTEIVRRSRASRRRRLSMAKNLQDLFSLKYQPIMDMDRNLLVGVIVSADLSIFDVIPEEKPTVDNLIMQMWDEIGAFAQRRQVFHIIMEVDGAETTKKENTDQICTVLQDIGYKDLTLSMLWSESSFLNPSRYKALETVANSGAMLAIDCTSVQFGMLSDMWYWPFHRLLINFDKLPTSDDSATWVCEIISNLAEQLQIETMSIGVSTKNQMDIASDFGFKEGAGSHFHPPISIETFINMAQPVDSKNDNDEAAQKETA